MHGGPLVPAVAVRSEQQQQPNPTPLLSVPIPSARPPRAAPSPASQVGWAWAAAIRDFWEAVHLVSEEEEHSLPSCSNR